MHFWRAPDAQLTASSEFLGLLHGHEAAVTCVCFASDEFLHAEALDATEAEADADAEAEAEAEAEALASAASVPSAHAPSEATAPFAVAGSAVSPLARNRVWGNTCL